MVCRSAPPLLLPALVAACFFVAGGWGCGGLERYGSDSAWWLDSNLVQLEGRPFYPAVNLSSRYLRMRDGVRLAVDIHLPEGLVPGSKIPAILFQTRYVRSLSYRWPFSAFLGGRFDDTIEYMVRRGYAWIAVDTRGSGASFGSRPYPYSPDEILDGAEIADWIVEQPWSNGRIGAWGNSYTGGTALMLLTNHHPAVKAVMPRFAMFDLFAEAVFPGGVHLRWLTDTWGRLAAALDANRLADFFGQQVDWAVAGIKPIDAPAGGLLLETAIRDHARNGDIRRLVHGITFRDDRSTAIPGLSIEAISPHTHLDALNRSDAAVYLYAGWFDSAFVLSEINLFLNLDDPRTRLTIGPWDHGGWQNISPWAARREPAFQKNAEILRFFDLHLKDRSTGIETEARVHYFTMGEERWKAANTWPPPGTFAHPLFMAPEEGLGPKPADGTAGSDAYRVDPATTSGPRSRWNSLVNLERRPVEYPDRRQADRALLCYTSAPLTRAVEVTGHPLAHLYVSSDAEDGNFFVYLEDVAPDGRVIYVTEGQLRALHRKTNDANARYTSPVPYRSFERADAAALVPGQVAELLIPLLPTSYLFKPGHAIRIAVAGADRGHFAPVQQNPPTIELHRSAAHPSRIELPLPAGTELDWFSMQKVKGSPK